MEYYWLGKYDPNEAPNDIKEQWFEILTLNMKSGVSTSKVNHFPSKHLQGGGLSLCMVLCMC